MRWRVSLPHALVIHLFGTFFSSGSSNKEDKKIETRLKTCGICVGSYGRDGSIGSHRVRSSSDLQGCWGRLKGVEERCLCRLLCHYHSHMRGHPWALLVPPAEASHLHQAHPLCGCCTTQGVLWMVEFLLCPGYATSSRRHGRGLPALLYFAS
jgi:hypothetical protein